ncbi:MAG: FkbM family methyltransferase [Alphaproteobacteria bacterium]|nr:FkbM family methyltransferase [Alphaproteobacteria bacterium]
MRIKLPHLQTLRGDAMLGLMGDQAIGLSLSQVGEDVVIAHMFENNLPPLGRPGFYVDIGAHHPRIGSNTFLLHLQGWKGVNVDASDASIEAFRRERPNDTNLCCAIGAVEGTTTFYEFQGGAASTCDPQLASAWRARGWAQVGEKHVPIRPLGRMLDEYVSQGTVIDFLNVDIEGLDEVALATVDLEKYRPKVIAIEMHNIDLLDLGANGTVRRLTEAGYKLMSVNIVTFIFGDARKMINL